MATQYKLVQSINCHMETFQDWVFHEPAHDMFCMDATMCIPRGGVIAYRDGSRTSGYTWLPRGHVELTLKEWLEAKQ